MIYVIALLLALAFIVLGIVRWKIHPFFVLLLSAIAYGFITGMGVEQIVSAVNDGFGSIMGKIGLIIFFGVAIGTILEKSGGAMVIASRMIKLIGEKSIHFLCQLQLRMSRCPCPRGALNLAVFGKSSHLVCSKLFCHHQL